MPKFLISSYVDNSNGLLTGFSRKKINKSVTKTKTACTCGMWFFYVCGKLDELFILTRTLGGSVGACPTTHHVIFISEIVLIKG